MEPNTSPLQDGTPYADPEIAWARIRTAADAAGETGFASWSPGKRNRWILATIKAAMAGRAKPEPEPEADQ